MTRVEVEATGLVASLEDRILNSPGQRSRLLAIRRTGAVGRFGHCLTGGLRLDGRVDLGDLARSLGHLLRRHPALTARFDDSELHTTAPGAARVSVRDVAGAGRAERWTRALELAEAASPLAPDGPDRYRMTLFRIDPDLHLMVLAVDPLVCDAWSMNLLISELATPAGERPHDDGYPTLWVERQRWLTSAAGVRAGRDRRARVAGALDRWPVGSARAASDTGRGTERYLAIDDHVADRIREKLRTERSTLLAVAAAAAVLGAVPSAEPLALRSTFVSRGSAAEEAVVGAMATQVVLRTPRATGTIAAYLHDLRAEVFACLGAQRVSSELVADTLALGAPDGASVALVVLPRDLSGGTQRDLDVAGARAERTAVSVCPTGADLDLFVLEGAPPMQTVEPAHLTIGACSWRGDDAAWVDAFLARWCAGFAALAETDWARDVAVARLRVEQQMPKSEASV